MDPKPPKTEEKTEAVELFEKFVSENKENLHIDSIIKSVMGKFIQRSQVGFQKYGTDLDRTDLAFPDWIQHAQEELMDGILYLEKLKRTWSSSIPKPTPP